MPEILTKFVGNDAVNVIMHMYLLSLGEFDFENFGSRSISTQISLWILFGFATFML